MNEKRTVNIHLTEAEVAELKAHVGTEEFLKAIGYLSVWNLSFPIVDIYRDSYGRTDMVAVYSNADEVRGYTIGAVFNCGNYGFHS